MENGFTLIKFANELDCNNIQGQPWFAQGQPSISKDGRDVDPFKESVKSFILCERLPDLQVELCSDAIPDKLLKQLRRVVKIAVDSKEVTKGRFARICIEVDFPNL